MGVKEYRLLTRTMKTITTRSDKLVKTKKRLTIEEREHNPKIKKLRKRGERLRAKEKTEVVRIKNSLAHVKEDEARVEKQLEQIQKRYEWGSAESLKKEIKETNEKFRTTSVFSFARRGELRERLKVLGEREEIVKNDDKGRSMLENQLRTIGYQRHNLEFELRESTPDLRRLEHNLKDLVKLRDSTETATKKEIKLLEEEIPQLWDSIAHLIPFSTALEKA